MLCGLSTFWHFRSADSSIQRGKWRKASRAGIFLLHFLASIGWTALSDTIIQQKLFFPSALFRKSGSQWQKLDHCLVTALGNDGAFKSWRLEGGPSVIGGARPSFLPPGVRWDSFISHTLIRVYHERPRRGLPLSRGRCYTCEPPLLWAKQTGFLCK